MSEKYEYGRLKDSMEAIGFFVNSQQKIFGMISAVLLLGNIEFIKVKKFLIHNKILICIKQFKKNFFYFYKIFYKNFCKRGYFFNELISCISYF